MAPNVVEAGAFFGNEGHIPFGDAVARFVGVLVEVRDGVAECEPGLLLLAEGAAEQCSK